MKIIENWGNLEHIKLLKYTLNFLLSFDRNYTLQITEKTHNCI